MACNPRCLGGWGRSFASSRLSWETIKTLSLKTKQNKTPDINLGTLKVQDKAADSVSGEDSLSLVHRQHLLVISLLMEKPRQPSCVSFIKAQFYFWRICPCDLTTSQKPHLLKPSHGGVRISTYGFQGKQAFRPEHVFSDLKSWIMTSTYQHVRI